MPADKRDTVKSLQAPYAKSHMCPHCAAAFGQASKLTTHVRVVHEKRRNHVE